MAVSRIARISLATDQPRMLQSFYREALGFNLVVSSVPSDGDGNVKATVLRLGEQILELIVFGDSGRPYPRDLAANDLRFQHFAIVVSDMALAYGRLREHGGWTPITCSGPQRLPASSGGVTAFKFRDPEGHPLELLAFPLSNVPRPWRDREASGTFMGIDHSAISVADTRRSIAFYEKLLGFSVAGQTLNSGSEQAQLDNLEGSVVEVTSLSPRPESCPHLELLCYRHPRPDRSAPLPENDVAATRLVVELHKDRLKSISNHMRDYPGAIISGVTTTGETMANLLIRDPDGHSLILMGRRE